MKKILALFVVLLFVAGCGGSQTAESHDFIDLETNYNLQDVLVPLHNYVQERDGYRGDYNDYICDDETDWLTVSHTVSIYCADVSCPLRGLDANGCIEHCKKLLERPQCNN